MSKDFFGLAPGTIGYAVHMEAGRAMAAILLGKPARAVTLDEASAALTDYVVTGNPDLTWQVVRAGGRAAISKLTPENFPASLAGEFVGALDALDAGEARGLATPADAARAKGPPGRRAELGQWLTMEIGFQAGALKIAFDAAVGLVTGVTRNGKPSPHGPALLPLGGAWDATRRFVDKARKANLPLWIAAKAQGEGLARGGKLDPEFHAYRRDVLATAKNKTAWRAVLKKAEMLAAN
jgi:hypothetical protein